MRPRGSGVHDLTFVAAAHCTLLRSSLGTMHHPVEHVVAIHSADAVEDLYFHFMAASSALITHFYET
tara:strand:+ start:8310 stop:8510 length:201 start_codon:yes stop_codon:yes gene_type:complete